MRELTLVFSGILSRFVGYAAVTSLLFSTWLAIDAERGTLLYALSTFCFIWGVLTSIAIVAWVWKETPAREDQHKQLMDYWAAETRLIAPPAPEAEPPAPRVPFPPESFVEFIWKWRDEHGKFPTIQDCEDAKINAQLAQYRYQQMVDAGYIVNRIERKSSGEPARSREDFIKAAIADNTYRAT